MEALKCSDQPANITAAQLVVLRRKPRRKKMVISTVFVHNIGVCLPLKVNMEEGAGQITNERDRERERGVATKSLQLLVFL